MTSSNGNDFRVTGPLRGDLTGHRWIPHRFDVFIYLTHLILQGWRYIEGPDPVITVPADAVTPNSANPSAGTYLNTGLNLLALSYSCSWAIAVNYSEPGYIFHNDHWDFTKSLITSSVYIKWTLACCEWDYVAKTLVINNVYHFIWRLIDRHHIYSASSWIKGLTSLTQFPDK